jgi:hypothetical protein
MHQNRASEKERMMPRMRSLEAAVFAFVGLTVLGRVSLSSNYHDPPSLRALSASEMNLSVKNLPPPTYCGGQHNTVTLCYAKSSTGGCIQATNMLGFGTCCTPASVPGNGLCGGQSVPWVIGGTCGYCKFVPPSTTCTETQCIWPCLCADGSCFESVCCSLPRPSCGSWCAVGNCGTSPPPCCN